ncbi:Dimethylaniline monooxygenase [N-oxide-forming] 5, partial [Stegodyphus mimosarum]
MEHEVNKKFDHNVYNLQPKHRILSAHPTINDALPNCILSGRVIVKGDIDRFEENGVIFAGEDSVTEVDAVILATGYQIKFPFLDKNMVTTEENRVHLYKYAIPPHLKHHNLIIIGLIQPIGAIFPVSEMQCRWFIQKLIGNLKFPSIQEMQKDIARKNEANEKRYVASTRHTIQTDWIPFMDELAEQIGAKPNMLKLAITDPKLFWVCMNGPCLPYQYRLQGPHASSGARNAILGAKDRMIAPLNSKAKYLAQEDKFISNKHLLFLLLLCTAGFFSLYSYGMNEIFKSEM